MKRNKNDDGYRYDLRIFNQPARMVSSCEEARLELVPVRKGRPDETTATVHFVEQFVKDVLDFSSQYGSNSNISYTAYNIAGNPSKFPDYGDFPQAFVMVIMRVPLCFGRFGLRGLSLSPAVLFFGRFD